MSTDLGKQISEFEESFEKVMVEIHTVATDITLGTFSSQKAKDAIEKTLKQKEKLEEIVQGILKNQQPEYVAKFPIFLTSYRPQLDAGLEAVKVAAASPKSPVMEYVEKETSAELKMMIEIQKTVENLKAGKKADGSLADKESSDDEVETEDHKQDDLDDDEDPYANYEYDEKLGFHVAKNLFEPDSDSEQEEKNAPKETKQTGYDYDEKLGFSVLNGLYENQPDLPVPREEEDDYEEEEEIIYEEEEEEEAHEKPVGTGFFSELSSML